MLQKFFILANFFGRAHYFVVGSQVVEHFGGDLILLCIIVAVRFIVAVFSTAADHHFELFDG